MIEKRRVEWRERGRGERNRERKKTGGEEIREREIEVEKMGEKRGRGKER